MRYGSAPTITSQLVQELDIRWLAHIISGHISVGAFIRGVQVAAGVIQPDVVGEVVGRVLQSQQHGFGGVAHIEDGEETIEDVRGIEGIASCEGIVYVPLVELPYADRDHGILGEVVHDHTTGALVGAMDVEPTILVDEERMRGVPGRVEPDRAW